VFYCKTSKSQWGLFVTKVFHRNFFSLITKNMVIIMSNLLLLQSWVNVLPREWYTLTHRATLTGGALKQESFNFTETKVKLSESRAAVQTASLFLWRKNWIQQLLLDNTADPLQTLVSALQRHNASVNTRQRTGTAVSPGVLTAN